MNQALDLASIQRMLGPDATLQDARDVAEIMPPEGWPPDVLQWVRDGVGTPPPMSASALTDLYGRLSDSRRADLSECARVISLAP